MLRDAVVKLVAWRLGNRKDMAERIIAEMDFVQETILEQHEWRPWFLEKSAEGLITSPGVKEIALPADFLGEVEGERVWLEFAEGALPLRKESYGDVIHRTGNAPNFYTVTPSQLIISPAPLETLPVSWRYAGKAAKMSVANVETPWLAYASDLVIAVLGVELAGKHLQNQILLGQFQLDMQQAWARLLAKDTEYRELNQTRVFGRGN